MPDGRMRVPRPDCLGQRRREVAIEHVVGHARRHGPITTQSPCPGRDTGAAERRAYDVLAGEVLCRMTGVAVGGGAKKLRAPLHGLHIAQLGLDIMFNDEPVQVAGP